MRNSVTPPTQPWLAIMMFAIFAWGLADIALDSPEELRPTHLAFEIGLLICSLSVGIWLWQSWRKSEKQLRVSEESLRQSQDLHEQWRQRVALLTEGFNLAVQAQLRDWQLTPSESEVAKYLLRGFSHKDIARFSKRSERTVRQHSVAVYKKANLAGRAELSAFFLEGLLTTTQSV